MLYLYDPRTNIMTETNYKYLSEIIGIKPKSLMSMKSKGRKISSINCYLVDETVTLEQRKTWYEKEKFEQEAWKLIIGSDEKFLISNYGRFKRLYKNGKICFLLPFLHPSGVLHIKVTYQGEYRVYLYIPNHHSV